jgi:hypothetical protein
VEDHQVLISLSGCLSFKKGIAKNNQSFIQIMIIENTMKKILYLLTAMIIMVWFPDIATAQVAEEKTEIYIMSDKQAQGQTKAMVRMLDLKGPAIKSVNDINLKYQVKTNTLRADTTSTVEKKEMHGYITEEKNAELRSVLSGEQYNKYIQSLEKARVQLYERLDKKP